MPAILDHKLLALIGKGSYGEVWLAENALGTRRAVKIVYRETFWDSRPFEREFKGIQKFEPLSRAHDGLVDILQVGRADDYFYYVMELADPLDPNSPDSASYTPKTLQSELKRYGRLPVTKCIEVALSLSSALEYLHQRGLVHRDIKPSNIIFVGGVPKLADIGLVAETSAARSYVGTDGFIAPEGPGTPQADLYSLGKLLYEISTGKDRHAFPELPADFAEQPETLQLVELNATVVKACENDVRRRYQSASEMYRDFALLKAGHSVKRKQSADRRLKILKTIGAATAASALIAATVPMFIREVSSGSSNAAEQLRKESANTEYVEGFYCWDRDTEEGMQKALERFNRALELDPNFILAYNGLFEVHNGTTLGLETKENWAKLRFYQEKLMVLGPQLAEAHAAKAWLDFLHWKWNEAEPEFQKAIQLNQKCAIAHMRYGFCLVFAGRPDEGLNELLTAEKLTPTSLRVKKNIGNAFYVKRDFAEAIRRWEKTTNLAPNYPKPHQLMASAYRAQGNYSKAITEFETYDLLCGKEPVQVKQHAEELRRAYAQDGARGYWLKCLTEAEQSGNFLSQAGCYANLGDFEQAFDLLEKVYMSPEYAVESLTALRWDPCWDTVHEHPRFIALLKKTGLKE